MTQIEIIQKYLDGSADIADLLKKLQGNIEDYNLVLSDLDHFLELEELSPEECVKILLYRKDVLQERRRDKDTIRVIEQILPKQIEGRTTQDRYEYALHQLSERVYTPRKLVLNELLDRGD